MSRKRDRPEQIMGVLREAEAALAQGQTASRIRHVGGIAEQTSYHRRREYGGPAAG